MKRRKRITWFVDPSRIRAVKIAAAETDRDQSDVVEEAIDEYFQRRSRKRPNAEPASAR